MAMAMVTTGGGLLISRIEVERNFIIGAVIKKKMMNINEKNCRGEMKIKKIFSPTNCEKMKKNKNRKNDEIK